MAADLDTVKIILRSLLMSTKRTMSVYDLQKDFRNNEGYECPYAALGYRNFQQFLEDLRDTVRVSPGGVVSAVTTEETQHIARLVALQKAPSVKSRRGGYRGSNQRSSSYSRPPRFQQSYTSSRPTRSLSESGSKAGSTYYASDRSSSTYYAPNRTSSTYTASNGTSSFHNASNRTYNSTYNAPNRTSNTYRASNGSSSTYNPSNRTSSSLETDSRGRSHSQADPSGYSSAEKFFEKVREVKGKARAEELLSTRQQQEARATTPTEAGWSGEAFITDWRRQLAVEDSPRRLVNYRPASSSEDSDDSFYERFQEEDNCEAASKYKPESAVVVTTEEPHFEPPDAINDRLRKNLQDLIKLYPDGLWSCVLPEKYEEKYGVSLQWNELGYDSIIQMVHDLQDIITCKRVQGGDWKLFDANLPVETVDKINKNAVHRVQCVSESVKSRIYHLVKKYTSGIRVDQLVQLYHETYAKFLLDDAPGFDNAESLFISIDGTVIRLRYIRQECYVLPGEHPLPVVTEPSVEVSPEEKKELGFYPTEVMGPTESYPIAQLSSKLAPGDYLELMVAEVYNPFKIWVMLREKSVELDKLMDELQDFYKDHGDKYLMPDLTVCEGQCCTAVYDGEWHRATITSVGNKIQVFYVDYGTVASVSKKELRFLHRDFSVLPAQAIRATLAGILPANGKNFTVEANRALLNFVADKTLIGCVQRVELEKPFLELFLIDTSGEEDIHLNDVLVNQNYAVYKPELVGPQESQPEPKETLVPPPATTKPESTVPVQSPTKPLSSGQPVCSGSSQQAESTTPFCQQPPPGFGPTAPAQIPPVLNNAGMLPVNNVNPGFNPLYNPTYPSPYLPQVNAALLLQQQQQQALLFAYYQNLYQQSVLSLQTRMAAASLTGHPPSTAWPCAPNSAPNPGLYSSAGSTSSPATSYAHHNDTSFASEVSKVEDTTKSASEVTADAFLSNFRTEPEAKSNVPSRPSEGVLPLGLAPMSDNSSSNSISELIVEHLDGRDSTSSIRSCASSYCNVAPDLVQSIAIHHSSGITNHWKVEEVCEQPVHVFNVDQKAYASVGELARKFTIFSTSDSLLRVLKNKGIIPECKKFTRQDRLLLFSSLDGCSEEFSKSLDLTRNKNGNVVGTLHLCPLSNVPAVLIPLGTDVSIINGFRALRDSFNPNESHWRN